jgi:hypothetical protein
MLNITGKDLFSVQNQVPGFASSLHGKYKQHSCLVLILALSASICCGAALLETKLTHRLGPSDTTDSMPAAAPPNPEQFLPDLKRVPIN